MDQSDLLFGKDDKPFGQTFSMWVEKWWKWLLEIPDAENPSNDSTGDKSSTNQNDPDVWFLTGAHVQKPYHTMATVERRCYVPGGKALGIALAANECCMAEFPYMDINELQKYAEAGDKVRFLKMSIDGKPLENMQEYGVKSKIFDVSLPKDNLFDAPPGPTKAVGHAFMVIVKPLPSGPHELIFSQITEAEFLSRTPAYGYHVTYHLDIFPKI
jgi:hypothetical protein